MNEKRTTHLKLSCFVCLSVLLGSLSCAQAFCVKNETNWVLTADQKTNHKMFQGFHESLGPGDNKCCSWQNDTCNKEGKETSSTLIEVSYSMPGGLSNVTIVVCDHVIHANETLAITGKDGNFSCESRP